MTTEHRLICDVDEVRGFVLQCGKCASRVSFNAGMPMEFGHLHRCPVCSHVWVDHGETADPWLKFMALVTRIQELNDEGRSKFRLRLDLDIPKN